LEQSADYPELVADLPSIVPAAGKLINPGVWVPIAIVFPQPLPAEYRVPAELLNLVPPKKKEPRCQPAWILVINPQISKKAKENIESMPLHLRNGKDLSFEQMLAAKRAAEQDAERAWQQQRFVKIANCQSASKNPSSTYQCGPTELPSSVNHPCSVEQASAVDHTSTAKLPITIYWLPCQQTPRPS
jgi:hypothetical protein